VTSVFVTESAKHELGWVGSVVLENVVVNGIEQLAHSDGLSLVGSTLTGFEAVVLEPAPKTMGVCSPFILAKQPSVAEDCSVFQFVDFGHGCSLADRDEFDLNTWLNRRGLGIACAASKTETEMGPWELGRRLAPN
jgi:hypothetical protein